jgi:hypothetical protein
MQILYFLNFVINFILSGTNWGAKIDSKENYKKVLQMVN